MLMVIFSLSGAFARRSFSEFLILTTTISVDGIWMASLRPQGGRTPDQGRFRPRGPPTSIAGVGRLSRSRAAACCRRRRLLRREPMLGPEAAQLYGGGILLERETHGSRRSDKAFSCCEPSSVQRGCPGPASSRGSADDRDQRLPLFA
jgi:hypothetical protein